MVIGKGVKSCSNSREAQQASMQQYEFCSAKALLQHDNSSSTQ